MATIKAQNNRRNATNDGWDVIHHETEASIVLMDDGVTSLSSRLKFQTAGGTATAITLTGVELTDGFQTTFVIASSNSGAATTINAKPLYKPGTTTAPKLIAGKAATVWYNSAGGCFFIKASAEGTAVASDVLAGKTFSNDDDTGLTGTYSNIKSIQRGLLSMTAASNAVTINSIDPSKSIVKITTYNTSGNYYCSIPEAVITNSTTITISTCIFMSAGSTFVAWEVIEFNNVKSKQSGFITDQFAEQEAVATVSSVNMDKSILESSFKATGSTSIASKEQAINWIGLQSRIISSTSVGFKAIREQHHIAWQLIEFN